MILIYEKDKVMKPYSRVLLINVAFDYFYTVVSMFIEMASRLKSQHRVIRTPYQELEMNGGVYIFIVNGIPKDFSPALQHLTVWFFNGAISSAMMVAPIEFIFRYCLVVKWVSLRN